MKKWWNGIKENWRVEDGPDGIYWPWTDWPSASMPFGFFRFWRLGISLTGAWGRPYIHIGPVLIIF